ncbi:MAG: superoxide dismutase [Candidatus Caenarcaniphilales bacterium]|nr:superoxide dismutase [Candidatus Caenarcaniphilales bacterium]
MTTMTTLNHTTNEKGEFYLPKLEYAYDALEPYIDAQTMELHYSKHHQTYITKLNAALESAPELKKLSVEELVSDLSKVPESIQGAVRNHGGGHANHCLFWSVIFSEGKGGKPSQTLHSEIDRAFGTYDAFVEKLNTATVGVFGSGWGWLSLDKSGKLIVETTPNQDSPLTRSNIPLIGIDVWEHAYYLKYQNKRPDYVSNFFKVINWNDVNYRYEAALKQIKG